MKGDEYIISLKQIVINKLVNYEYDIIKFLEKDLIIELVNEKYLFSLEYVQSDLNNFDYMIEFAHEDILSNIEIAKLISNKNPLLLKYFSDDIRNNKEIINLLKKNSLI